MWYIKSDMKQLSKLEKEKHHKEEN